MDQPYPPKLYNFISRLFQRFVSKKIDFEGHNHLQFDLLTAASNTCLVGKE